MTGRVLLVATLLVLSGLTGFTGAAAPLDVGDPTDSAVTVSGTGEFADLRVTINQSKNLINQTVRVSWTGGVPTPAGPIQRNFLQIMQCWSDDPAGPDRTQCQFGALPLDNTGELRTRHLLNSHVTDPLETLDPTRDNYLPYWVPGQPKPVGLTGPVISEYLDSQISNEAPQLRTRSNGSGEEFFEIQTFRENAGLDCGRTVGTGAAVTGKSCWLVIVPRGTTEVDGSRPGPLESSPLSLTNWAKRMQVKLEFLPVEQACQLGAAERPVRGHELAVEAISRWQPALCRNNGPVFTYTQYSDATARSELTGPNPSLQVLVNPLPAEAAADRPVIYAPIALSGFAIAFNIEYQPFRDHENERIGTRFDELKLTPRLVAKLLTQSYKGSIAGDKKHLNNNPSELTRDPEFVRLNPEYQFQDSSNRPAEPIVFFGNADVTGLLWAWVLGDAEAREFLDGKPDQDGMIVNPKNRGITESVPVFPRNDDSCEDVEVPNTSIKVPTCTGDQHPVASDMHEGGRSAGRGEFFSRTPEGVVPGSDPPIIKYSRPGRMGPGTRSVMAVVDTATAARHGMKLAKLRNAAGQFVAPTPESLRAGLAAMKPSGVAGVLQPDPRTTNVQAYPLTALSYAATTPSRIDKPAGAAYAQFLTYAAGAGQDPGVNLGELPEGYEPLPESLRKQTVDAAAEIQRLAGVPVAAPPAETPGGGGDPGTSPPPAGGGSNTSGASGAGNQAPAAGPAPPAAAPGPAAPGRETAVVTRAEPTPAVPAPRVWALIVGLLVCAAVAGALSPLAFYLSGRRAGIGEGR